MDRKMFLNASLIYVIDELLSLDVYLLGLRRVVKWRDVPQIKMRSVVLDYDVPQTNFRRVVSEHDALQSQLNYVCLTFIIG